MIPLQLLTTFVPAPSRGSVFVYMKVSYRNESYRLVFTPVVASKREFHSGTKSRNEEQLLVFLSVKNVKYLINIKCVPSCKPGYEIMQASCKHDTESSSNPGEFSHVNSLLFGMFLTHTLKSLGSR